MKTAADLPAVLTVHETTPGQYVLRVSDLKYRALIVGVSKLLDDATSLIIVSPSDIKVLKVSGSGLSGAQPAQVAEPGRENEVAGAADPTAELDPEMLAAIAEQEALIAPQVSDPVADQPQVKAEAGMRVVRRKPNGKGPGGHTETCGRCRGQGEIRIIEEGGSAGTAKCGVCQGAGVIQRYGNRR